MKVLSGCVLVYRYTKERNINELRHNSMYGYKNNRWPDVWPAQFASLKLHLNLYMQHCWFSKEGKTGLGFLNFLWNSYFLRKSESLTISKWM